LRPAYQSLLEDARHGQFDVVVAEALDRLSRDQPMSGEVDDG
jgi:site-specific DNA recombinase